MTTSTRHQRSMARSETLNEQLQTALTSKVIIGQAKGKLAERLGLDMEQAFALLRRPPWRQGAAWRRLTGIISWNSRCRVPSVVFMAEARDLAAGRDPALLLKQEGVLMFSTDLSTRDCDGHVVVALRGELDLADAAEVAAVLVAVAARGPQIIVDLAGLEIIDSSGVAALARGRKHARQAGGDLLLAAPQQRVMRILVITRLADGFSVYDSVEEAAVSPRHRMPAAVQAPGTAVLLAAHPPSAAAAALSTSVLSRRVGVAGKCSDTADDRCYPALSEDRRSREWVRYARAQCLGCTVRDECLELALRYETLTGASHGVWGGTAPNERKEMLARRRRTRPARRSRAQTLRGAAS